MATQLSEPINHHYSEVNTGKFERERHYELNQVVNGSSVFTVYIKISEDRKSAKSKPRYCLEIRGNKKWKTPTANALIVTNFPGIFKKDSQNKKHLIIVKFSDDASQINISYLKDFFTSDLKALTGSTIR